MEHTDRAARQGANIARHLNQSYPDTVLFLARHAGGRPHATAAELHTVDDDSLLMSITEPNGSTTAADQVRVPLPAGPTVGADIRARVRELLRLTRLHAPDEPLTSLELQAGGGHTTGPHGTTPHHQQ